MPDPDILEKKINEIISNKLDALLKPIVEKLDALTPKKDDDESKETGQKLDAFQLAEQTLRAKLDGFIPKEELDKLDMIGLSQTLSKLQSSITKPSQGGNLNQIHDKDSENKKLDAVFGESDPNKIIWN